MIQLNPENNSESEQCCQQVLWEKLERIARGMTPGEEICIRWWDGSEVKITAIQSNKGCLETEEWPPRGRRH